jgi:hypothetical protein
VGHGKYFTGYVDEGIKDKAVSEQLICDKGKPLPLKYIGQLE